MLIYHPAHDINHCIYRVLRILEHSSHAVIDWELMRLLDFYSLFPSLLKNISPFPRELLAYKRIVNEIPDAYETVQNKKRIFYEIMPIQITAIQNLVAKNLIDANAYKKSVIKRSNINLPQRIQDSLSQDEIASEEWFSFVINELPNVEFRGGSGLKYRSKMMEFRYDPE